MPLSALLFLLIAAGWSLFLLPPAWFPAAISGEALQFQRQFARTLWVTGAVFTVVQLALSFALLRKRGATPGSAAREPRWATTAWIVAAGVLLLEMGLAGSRNWAAPAGQTQGIETIEVYAHQFQWNFRYPGPDGRFGRTSLDLITDSGGNPIGVDPADPRGQDDVTTATLRIPTGKKVLLVLHSRDVVHDFFVRELRTKQDVIPGMEIPLEISVDRPGRYEIACAELCGLGHSQMRGVLLAMSPAEYQQWKTSAAEKR